MYKLVCIDIDGTLLNSKHKVSDFNKKALKKAYESGVLIVITTGRIYINAAYYSKLIGVKSPVIAANGAIIKDTSTNEFLCKCIIPKEINKSILEICNKYKVNPRFHTSKEIYDGKNSFNFMNLLCYYGLILKVKSKQHRVVMHHIRFYNQWGEILNTQKNEIIKCEIYSFNIKKIRNVREELKKIHTIGVVGSGKYGLEITNNNISKGSAVKYLAELYKIKKEEVMAIGDNENDIEMIQYAGLGVAMGNALEIVKKKANYVTTSNDDDGVAKVINKFILNK